MHIDYHEYTILIADDSASNLEKTKHILEKEAFNVITTPVGEEVIPIVKTKSPDIIILALTRINGEGMKITQKLKSDPQTKLIPIIYLTTGNKHEEFAMVSHYDGVEFISRPLSKQELLIRLNNQLLLLESLRIIERQNEKLQNVVRAKDKLYSVIAHDLRAPIGTIKMILEAIDNQKSKIPDENIRHLLQMVIETTDEAFSLLENLLLWSNSQNGRLEANPQEFNLTATIRQATSLFDNVAKAKGIKIHNEVKQHFEAYADTNMINTAIRNLLSNAIKFTYPNGEIHVDCQKHDNKLIISVKDNGQGIKREDQRKLLDKGSYITSFGTQKEKGSGLGLQLSQEFVKLNHGKLWFESTEGKGTTFYFSVPTKPLRSGE
ncbi:hybrid sensor histidine kinase/response regulator [uncultured Sanguibacteroides sp.]|uniref:hybrid sensor histidine kinase/response regulator n=1 Tax=uncultured Sanguibacteroides sp. TaxID=1635151 RepID=UPI0025ECDDA0|nr:hybrid sensor histidine kinase/response regulator [uncultured Sanguibacteroides sp.]